jgi:predicted nucleotide-binding protein
MAKKNSDGSGTPELVIRLAEADKQLRDRVEKGYLLTAKRPTTQDEFEVAKRQYYTWDEYNTALLGRIFSNAELAEEYSYWGIAAALKANSSLADHIGQFVDHVATRIQRLESIIERLPLYTPNREIATLTETASPTTQSRNVFVVHGRNNELKEAVARYLVQLELIPVILHEQASAGQTIIEKFEANSASCFTVVLLTPDDVGCLAPAKSIDNLSRRARQNVIFEWGFFVAKLGRRNVCALAAEDVEIPSDLLGIAYVPLDQKGAWKMLLARELKAGGIEVDLNRAI